MMKMKRSLYPMFLLILMTGLNPAPSYAGTQAEYQALQQWCAGRIKWTAEGRKTDYPNPKEYFHFHHYCGALEAMDRLYATLDPKKQRYEAGLVVGETGYVIGHVAENHFLMPEMYALRGRALMLVKQTSEAEISLNKALQLDPRHVGAYVSLANLYLETNRKVRATEATKAGLALDSQNKSLLRLAKKLDIKLDEFQVKKEQPSAAINPDEIKQPAVDVEPKQSSEKPAAIATPSAPPSQTPAIQVVDEKSTKDDKKANNFDSAPTKGGTPKNPWCRFCPD